VNEGILVNMLKKEKQRNGTLVGSSTKSSERSSPVPSTPGDSAPIGNRKWTVGQQSSVAHREERTKNVICKLH